MHKWKRCTFESSLARRALRYAKPARKCNRSLVCLWSSSFWKKQQRIHVAHNSSAGMDGIFHGCRSLSDANISVRFFGSHAVLPSCTFERRYHIRVEYVMLTWISIGSLRANELMLPNSECSVANLAWSTLPEVANVSERIYNIDWQFFFFRPTTCGCVSILSEWHREAPLSAHRIAQWHI